MKRYTLLSLLVLAAGMIFYFKYCDCHRVPNSERWVLSANKLYRKTLTKQRKEIQDRLSKESPRYLEDSLKIVSLTAQIRMLDDRYELAFCCKSFALDCYGLCPDLCQHDPKDCCPQKDTSSSTGQGGPGGGGGTGGGKAKWTPCVLSEVPLNMPDYDVTIKDSCYLYCPKVCKKLSEDEPEMIKFEYESDGVVLVKCYSNLSYEVK